MRNRMVQSYIWKATQKQSVVFGVVSLTAADDHIGILFLLHNLFTKENWDVFVKNVAIEGYLLQQNNQQGKISTCLNAQNI